MTALYRHHRTCVWKLKDEDLIRERLRRRVAIRLGYPEPA